MPREPFPYRTPLGPQPAVALLVAPPQEIGDIVWGYSNAPLNPKASRPWWHPLRNPVYTVVIAAVCGLAAAASGNIALGAAICVLGYLFAKGFRVLVIKGSLETRNFFVGTNGIFDVIEKRSNQLNTRLILWDDIGGWSATETLITSRSGAGLQKVCYHSQLDRNFVKMSYINPFQMRFQHDLTNDHETVMFLDAYHRWVEHKKQAMLLQLKSGQSVALPIADSTEVNMQVTGLRPNSELRIANGRVSVNDRGRMLFDAACEAVTVKAVEMPETGQVRLVHCVLTAGDQTWNIKKYELLGADALASLVAAASQRAA